MYRGGRLVIRLNKTERYAIERLAIFLNIPASTLARALLLHEAQRRGIWQSGEEKSTENTSVVSIKVEPILQTKMNRHDAQVSEAIGVTAVGA